MATDYASNALGYYIRGMSKAPTFFPYLTNDDPGQAVIDYWAAKYPSWYKNFSDAVTISMNAGHQQDLYEALQALGVSQGGILPESPESLFNTAVDISKQVSIKDLFTVLQDTAITAVNAGASVASGTFSNLGTVLKYAPYALGAVGLIYLWSMLPKMKSGFGGLKANPHRSKMTSTVQSLVFDRAFFTETSAKAWALHHGFRSHSVDITNNKIRLRQLDPKKFKRFTTKPMQGTVGIMMVLGWRK